MLRIAALAVLLCATFLFVAPARVVPLHAQNAPAAGVCQATAPASPTHQALRISVAPCGGLSTGQKATLSIAATASTGKTVRKALVDFGNGSKPQLLTPASPGASANLTASYRYAKAGAYSVKVATIDSSGQVSSASLPVQVNASANSLNVTLTASPNPVTMGQNIDFTMTAIPGPGATSITGFVFDPGDGSQSTLYTSPFNPPNSLSVSYTYVTEGTFTASVIAQDNVGNTGTARVVVQVCGSAPGVCVSLSSLSGNIVSTNQLVTFQASAVSSDPGAAIVGFTFDFGDNSAQFFVPAPASNNGSATVETSHSYSAAGLYTVTVQATDSTGAAGSASTTLAVVTSGQQVQVTIAPSTSTIAAGQPVTFTISATTPNSGATIPSIRVDFGDGTPAQTIQGDSGTLTHTYSTTGSYTVTATATDSTGATGSESTQITVTAPVTPPPLCPAPSPSQSPTTQDTGVANANGPYQGFDSQPISFSAAGSQPPPGSVITAYIWNFGDSPTDTPVVTSSQTIDHTYKASFTYTVTLSVESACQAVTATGTPETDANGNPVLILAIASASTIAVVNPPAPTCAPATGAGPFGAGSCQTSPTSCAAGAAVGSTAVSECSVAPLCTGAATASACSTACPLQGLSQLLRSAVCPQPPPVSASAVAVSAGGPYQGTVGTAIQFSGTASGSYNLTACTDGSNYGLPGLACTTSTQPASSGSFFWDFGDGTSATGAAVTHTYASPGTYTVTLTLSLGDAGLFTGQTTATVTTGQ